MHVAYFRFYEELNDFLPEEKQKIEFENSYIDRTSVKDMVESLGVPHTEIDLILVNGKSVTFNYIINDGDHISVYPVFESLDISNVQHLRSKPLREPKFVVDVHLGKLTRYLRMMGFDVAYESNFSGDEIVKISLKERRAILTKDRGILKRNEVTHGYWLRSTIVKEQLVEIVKRFDLKNLINEFTRCIECNSLLKQVFKDEIIEELPPNVSASQTEFSRCVSCGKNYWKGTHYQKMNAFIQSLMNSGF
jgi:uncharacterized protein with PIN domain